MDTQAIENEREMEMAPGGGGGDADFDFSASLKKKKKKKGKEDTSGVAAEKKFPKHVLEKQKILAMREQKQKQEDEERLEAERQEQIQKEEEIREAQRKILRDNEKKKQKLLQKKLKEEAFRQLPTGEPSQTTTTGKRPLYQKKKKKKPTSVEEVVVVKEEEEQIKREEEIREAEQKIQIQILSDNEMKKKKQKEEAFLHLPTGEPSQKTTTGKRPLYQKKNKKPTEAAKSMKEMIPNKEEVVGVKEEEQSLLRSPICCIMGHVDAGKTRLLDYIRGTNVQEGEAGGITQQIGATYFPADNLRERTRELKADAKMDVPGLLVIDTPGHESFSNLRSRGSGLCDIAVLVVDIMHGLKPQTIESLNLLKMRNTNFIVALNKVDRLNGWKTCRNAPIRKAMEKQNVDVKSEFQWRLAQIKTQLMEQGLNAELYYKNKNMEETLCIVPTSAISGEGNPDLLLLLVMWAQKALLKRLTYSNELQCTVLEVKVVEGLGTTIDVVLVNGVLHEGDQIVVCGLHGAIVTTIRALLTPHPMKELRVKGTYLHHKNIKAAQGIKITAQGLEHTIAGTSLYVVKPHDDLESVKKAAVQDLKSVMSRINKSCEGVYVQASTLGSLEALLEFLKTPAVNIPVSGISIGPVHKKDVIKASVMLEKEKEYGTILAFDVKVTQEARELADERGVKIFTADVIYHLFDQFKAYIDLLKEERKKNAAEDVVYPCVLKIMPNCVFNKKDPIVLGVEVLEGVVKVGTPLWVPQREFLEIGRIASVENNRKPVDFVKKGQQVAIKIIGSDLEGQQKLFGRHFDIEDELVSKISRDSVNPQNYAESFGVEASRLLSKLKGLFKIQ